MPALVGMTAVGTASGTGIQPGLKTSHPVKPGARRQEGDRANE